MKLAHLHHKTKIEPVWHVQLAVLVAIGLQITLNNSLTPGPKYIVAGFEVLLLIALAVIKPGERSATLRLRRSMAVALIALISIVNIGSLVIIIDTLFNGGDVTGRQLIISAVTIYLTNIIMFGLWYWELDNVEQDQRDFLFPQMSAKETATMQPGWQPAFFDYLYVSLTNATAWSPTDTNPLTPRAKLLMGAQSLTSLTTVVLVTARAVAILG